MRRTLLIAIGLLIASLSTNLASAQDNRHDNKKTDVAAIQKQKDQRNRQAQQNKDARNRQTQRNQDQRNRQVQQDTNQRNRQTQNQRDQDQQNRQAQQNQDARNRQTQRNQDQRNRQVQQDTNQRNRGPRPGQVVVRARSDWTPNSGHRYNSASYTSINIWGVSSFQVGGRSRSWDPSAWHYYVDDSLMEIVYRSERISNSLRDSFEHQVTQNDLRSSAGASRVWNRVQNLDESLENLRSQIGNVSNSEMQNSTIDVLAKAQQLSNSFKRRTELRDLVQYQWDDLKYELNELARYYDETPIR